MKTSHLSRGTEGSPQVGAAAVLLANAEIGFTERD